MVVVEEQHHQESKWYRDKHPFNIERPKRDDPVSLLGWLERPNDRHTI